MEKFLAYCFAISAVLSVGAAPDVCEASTISDCVLAKLVIGPQQSSWLSSTAYKALLLCHNGHTDGVVVVHEAAVPAHVAEQAQKLPVVRSHNAALSIFYIQHAGTSTYKLFEVAGSPSHITCMTVDSHLSEAEYVASFAEFTRQHRYRG